MPRATSEPAAASKPPAAASGPESPGPAPIDLAAHRKARGWRGALRDELRRHVFAYVTIAAFLVLGPILTWMIFPEASLTLGLFGGMVFGVFFAFCAVPDKILE